MTAGVFTGVQGQEETAAEEEVDGAAEVQSETGFSLSLCCSGGRL